MLEIWSYFPPPHSEHQAQMTSSTAPVAWVESTSSLRHLMSRWKSFQIRPFGGSSPSLRCFLFSGIVKPIFVCHSYDVPHPGSFSRRRSFAFPQRPAPKYIALHFDTFNLALIEQDDVQCAASIDVRTRTSCAPKHPSLSVVLSMAPPQPLFRVQLQLAFIFARRQLQILFPRSPPISTRRTSAC